MSDTMSFLTGAAFAGVAVLFMIKGGDNLSATNLPSTQPLPVSPNNPYETPYNPYLTPPPTSTTASPNLNSPNYQQQLELAQIQPMLEQQRTEIEQLKVQMQNQQLLIDSLTSQVDAKSLPSWENPESAIANSAQPEVQQQDNKLVSGIIWALGGIAITMSGGVVVLGALALLLRQQRPPRTTYVVQNPYNSLPPSVSPRRRSEFVQPQYEDRRIDQMDY
ncbi:MAG: hypothetical protein F6K58_01165 [Symploca sp. SIO2E9]|nr:hypothetical protein [Symploca sp. SIO2E9]